MARAGVAVADESCEEPLERFPMALRTLPYVPSDASLWPPKRLLMAPFETLLLHL